MFNFFNKDKLPIDIIDKQEDGFIDLKLEIRKLEVKDGYFVIDAYASYKKQLLQLCFYVKENMEGFTRLENSGIDFKFYEEGIKIKSVGNYSDDFLKALIEVYQLHDFKGKMKKEVITTCVTLEESHFELLSKKVNSKCIFNPDDEDDERYAELYLNFDVPNGIIEFKEKDSDYRENIVKAFTEGL